MLAHGRWFSPGTPSSSTTKAGGHDIAEILLKVALNTKNKKSINHMVWKTHIKQLFFEFSTLIKWDFEQPISFFNTNITDFIQYISCYILRVQVPLKYPCEILSREIFKIINTIHIKIYYLILIYFFIVYSLFNIFVNNEFIPSNLFSFIFLWNSFLNKFSNNR